MFVFVFVYIALFLYCLLFGSRLWLRHERCDILRQEMETCCFVYRKFEENANFSDGNNGRRSLKADRNKKQPMKGLPDLEEKMTRNSSMTMCAVAH